MRVFLLDRKILTLVNSRHVGWQISVVWQNQNVEGRVTCPSSRALKRRPSSEWPRRFSCSSPCAKLEPPGPFSFLKQIKSEHLHANTSNTENTETLTHLMNLRACLCRSRQRQRARGAKNQPRGKGTKREPALAPSQGQRRAAAAASAKTKNTLGHSPGIFRPCVSSSLQRPGRAKTRNEMP